jgi:hypothetical protein
MSRTLKIAIAVCLSGLLLITVAAMAFYAFVSGLREGWVDVDRDALQQGAAAGKGLRDAECVEQALARLRDGRAGDAGIHRRPWIEACLRSATPTAEFLPRCAAADEAQTYCGIRATAP